MNKIGSKIMGYFAIQFVSEVYTLKEDTTHYRQIITDVELVVKANHSIFIIEKKKCHWEKKQQQKAVVVPTITIVHPYLDAMGLKYVHYIIRGV